MVDGPDQAIVERHILLLLHETLRMMIIYGRNCIKWRGEDSINENVCNCENQRSHSGS